TSESLSSIDDILWRKSPLKAEAGCPSQPTESQYSPRRRVHCSADSNAGKGPHERTSWLTSKEPRLGCRACLKQPAAESPCRTCKVRDIRYGLRAVRPWFLELGSRHYNYLLCDSTRTKRSGPKSNSAEFSSVQPQLRAGVVRLSEELKRNVEELPCHW